MKKILLLCTYCSLLFTASAQTDDKKWNVGLHGGAIQYSGDIGSSFYTTDQAWYGFAGLSVSRYLGKHFDASLFFTRGETGFIDHNRASTPEQKNYFLLRHNTGALQLKFNFTGPQYPVRPYIFAGASTVWYESVYDIDVERFEFGVPNVGGGLTFQLGPVVALQLQESFMRMSTDNLDHNASGAESNDNDWFLYHSAGITFNFGKKKDADLDGISDRKDNCPNTPTAVAVDALGCPIDRDGDGIADYQDNCPEVAGIGSLKGCPDKDQDGLADGEDRCPDVAGPADMRGCPDTDKDGVVDIDDKCAGTKTGYKVDATGCTLDNDKDGLVNEEDACPDAAGVLALKGCPDSDGDGVADNTDLCPQTKGTLANKGCPEIPKEDILRITVIASKIYFETNSAKLKLISNSQLDDLAEILKRNQGVNLTIEGHTDNVGNDDYNMTLSQKRTESVREYLISKGVSGSRLTAVGYGETKPIATNANATGKAKNRRVELKTSY
ncbi:MAG: OmpA/MotB domain protein [Bacteroidetes bacterium]|jgi:outer membrane protein OmpA-like peptidoglycan-associated protein|nr:OmpA/MotB domain protein [Bacteroidota bacterium]